MKKFFKTGIWLVFDLGLENAVLDLLLRAAFSRFHFTNLLVGE